jgi:hypothetical protein
LLEGGNVRLKVMEKEDLDFFVECHNDVAYYGEDGPIMTQMSRAEARETV